MPPDRLPAPTGRSPWAARLLEVAAVALVFAAAGSWPAPDTNEPHYLAKARHFHDPSWCAGDFFLETSEAHHVFYRLMGPVAATLTLEQAAWAGRTAGWLALAAGILWSLSAVVDQSPGFSWWRLLAAGIFSLAVRHTTASGEWVIGGCEGKVFAWAAVLASAGWFARGRPDIAWLASGIATAFHAVVGGWSLVACVLAMLMTRSFQPGNVMAWIAGAALAAIGVGPALALSRGVDPAAAFEAIRAYVVERLPHHLLVDAFADGMVARHVLAIVLAWTLLASVRRAAPLDRLAAFVAAAVAIAIGGCFLSLLSQVVPQVALPLARFYWFRLADGLVPLLLAVAATLAFREEVPARLGRGMLAATLSLLAVDLVNESRHWPLPWRPEVVSRADRHVVPAAWKEVCVWVRDNTPPSSRFLTPRGSSSFQWRAERPEVVAWKHVPQDLASIVEWRRRLLDAFAAEGVGSLRSLERSTAVFGGDRVREIAERYDADYCIVPIDDETSAGSLPFERVFANARYAVYRMPR